MKFSPFLRQVFVAVGPQLGALSLGGSLGYPCVLLQQLNSKESDIQPDLETMTWITSMHGITGVGAILMPSIMQLKGRKFTLIGSCLLLIIGWSLMFLSKEVYTILLSKVFLGLGSNCISVVNLMTISEMLAPKYRTVSMMLLEISQALGVVLVMTVGTLMQWRNVALLLCSPVVLALIMITLWPESPAWLIYKGRIEECENAFIWLRGTDDEAKQELQLLKVAQRENEQRTRKKSTWQETIKKKDFYLPSLHMCLILSNFYLCGGICVVIYSKDIMKAATGDENAALFGYLMVNATYICGAVLSLICIRYLNSKTIMYIGAMCNVFLLAAAIITNLQSFGIISKDPLLFICVFLGILVCYNSGFCAITFTVAIEIVPVKHRGLGGALYYIITGILYFSTLKLFPYMIIYLDVWGTFLLFAGIGIICTFLIWRYVPETKGRTLQEIEDYYNYGYFVKNKDFEDVIEVTRSIVENNIK